MTCTVVCRASTTVFAVAWEESTFYSKYLADNVASQVGWQGCQMAVFAANLAIFGRMAMAMATRKIKWPEGRKEFQLAMKILRGFFTNKRCYQQFFGKFS